MDKIEIRPFTADDSNGAAGVHEICFAHDPWPTHAFTRLLETGAEGYVAEAGSRMVGLILCRAAGDEAEILTFAVMPSTRRMGIGARLLASSIEMERAKGVERMLLEVAKNNKAALSLYTAAGFETVGERSGYYVAAEGPVDAYIMLRSIAANS